MFSGEGPSSHPSQQNSLFSLLSHPSTTHENGQQLPPFARPPPSLPPPSLGPRLSALPIHHNQNHQQQHPRGQFEMIDLTGEGDDEDDDHSIVPREGKRQREGGGGAEGHLGSNSSSSSRAPPPPSGPPAGWAPALPLPLWSQDAQKHPHQQHPPQQHHHSSFQPSPTSTSTSSSSFPSNFVAPPTASSSASPANHLPPFNPSRQSSTSSFPPPPPSHHHHQQQQHQHRPNPSSSSSSSSRLASNSIKRQPSPIDVDDYPSPPPRLPSPPPPPPPPPSNNPQPTLIGYLATTALILYPSPYLDNSVEPGQPLTRNYSRGEVLVVGDQEWGRVKLKVIVLSIIIRGGNRSSSFARAHLFSFVPPYPSLPFLSTNPFLLEHHPVRARRSTSFPSESPPTRSNRSELWRVRSQTRWESSSSRVSFESRVGF